MSKYLNVFNTLAECQAFSASTEYVQPNVALVKETNVLYYDYGNNKPQADMSSYKGEFQESSVGGDKYGKTAITKVNYIPSGITSLNSAFDGLSSLKELTCKIPNSVNNIEFTFNGCTSLVTSPEIPSGVTSMFGTFQHCKSLVNAPSVIPNSVINMNSTFNGCKGLVNAPEIPSGVKDMWAAFESTNIVIAPDIPSGVKDVSWIFANCQSLKEVTFLMTTPLSYSMVVTNCPSLETIYVPDESVDAYKTATGWSEFADKFKPLSSKPTK